MPADLISKNVERKNIFRNAQKHCSTMFLRIRKMSHQFNLAPGWEELSLIEQCSAGRNFLFNTIQSATLSSFLLCTAQTSCTVVCVVLFGPLPGRRAQGVRRGCAASAAAAKSTGAVVRVRAQGRWCGSEHRGGGAGQSRAEHDGARRQGFRPRCLRHTTTAV